MYGPLHFRITEGVKSEALKQNSGNFEAHMCLTPLAKCELQWWIDSVDTAVNRIYREEPQVTIRTDASKRGWGCAVNKLATGGLWTPEESCYHINYLEMLAVLFGLKAYKQLVSGKHVKVMVDNTTAQATINKMGTSHSPQLNTLTKTIWDWCITNDIWLTIARIPGLDNIEADRESRKSRRCTEWCLNKDLFRQACEKLQFSPNIDLFASRINHQVKPFISYHPDPEALAVNAFHQAWVAYRFYAFPPFSIISQVLQKIQKEGSEGLVLVPKWTTQTWWPVAMQMLVQLPVVLPRSESTLFLPSNPKERHSLHKNMSLVVCHLSGDTLKAEGFRRQLQRSWRHPGDPEPENNTQATCQNGNYTVVRGTLIPFVLL